MGATQNTRLAYITAIDLGRHARVSRVAQPNISRNAGGWPRLPLLCGEGGVLRPPWAASVLGQDQPQGAGIEGGNPLAHGD